MHLAEIVETRKSEGADVAAARQNPTAPGAASAGCGSGSGTVAGGSTENGGAGKAAGGGAAGGCGGVGSVYVHYVDFDRRLDEWVGMERVDLAAGQQRSVAAHNGDKRRVTTRMKRE